MNHKNALSEAWKVAADSTISWLPSMMTAPPPPATHPSTLDEDARADLEAPGPGVKSGPCITNTLSLISHCSHKPVCALLQYSRWNTVSISDLFPWRNPFGQKFMPSAEIHWEIL